MHIAGFRVFLMICTVLVVSIVLALSALRWTLSGGLLTPANSRMLREKRLRSGCLIGLRFPFLSLFSPI